MPVLQHLKCHNLFGKWRWANGQGLQDRSMQQTEQDNDNIKGALIVYLMQDDFLPPFGNRTPAERNLRVVGPTNAEIASSLKVHITGLPESCL